MEKALGIITRAYGRVYPSGFYLYYTLAAITFLFLRRKIRPKEKLMGIYSAVIFMIISLPPFAMVVWRFFRNGGVYWRLFWLIPYAVLISYAGCELVFKPEKKLLKAAVAAVFTALIILGGNNVYTGGVFEKAVSREKLPHITLAAVDAINKNAEETGNPYKRVAAPADIYCQIRQIDATILQYGSRVLNMSQLDGKKETGYFFRIMNGMEKDKKKKVAKYLRYNECNYIVFPLKYAFMRTLHNSQMYRIYTDDKYTIWYHPYIENTKHADDYK